MRRHGEVKTKKETCFTCISDGYRVSLRVNSGLTAVLNVSLADFLRQRGLEQEFFHIHEVHAVNMRRYWSGDTLGTLGVHAMDINNVVSTPANWHRKLLGLRQKCQ